MELLTHFATYRKGMRRIGLSQLLMPNLIDYLSGRQMVGGPFPRVQRSYFFQLRAHYALLLRLQRIRLRSGNLQNYFSEIFTFEQKAIGFAYLGQRECVSDYGTQSAGVDPLRQLRPGSGHQASIPCELRQPESMNTGCFLIQDVGIELSFFAGGRTVGDDTAKLAQAANTLGEVLAAQHLEDDIDPLPIG